MKNINRLSCYSSKWIIFTYKYLHLSVYNKISRQLNYKYMKLYNRIMLGEGGRYVKDCLDNNYIGVNFLKDIDLSNIPHTDESVWKQNLVAKYLESHPDKTSATARMAIGFMWTVCYGLKTGDVVLAPNGEGGYYVAEITGSYFYAQGKELSHRRTVKWLNVIIQRSSMSQKLQNSTGSIGTCCNISKYADELQQLINGSTPIKIINDSLKVENFKERSLHRLLSNYLFSNNILCKTIFHETSSKAYQAQKWVHPDMVGVRFNEFQEQATRALLKASETKEYVALYSYELKRTIENDHQLKEYFFQALSNSSWANYGYLVAFEINEDVMEEMERLNRAFGIGVIKLSPYTDDTKELFPARKNELDYYTIDKLCRINSDLSVYKKRRGKVPSLTLNHVSDIQILQC